MFNNFNLSNQYINYKRAKEIAINEQLKHEHIQASIELSGGKSINNREFRKWNSSAYEYNKNTNEYQLRKEIITSFDVPKKIKWIN